MIPFNSAGKWGFCNAGRDIVIACEYDAVQCFSSDPCRPQDEPLALVRSGILPQEWRHGMINPQGEVRIPLDYANLEPFAGGFAKMRRHGKSLYGFIDPLGRLLTHHEFETAQSFSEGLAYVSRPPRKRVQEHGFLDSSGDIVLSGRLLFDDARPFQQGLAVVTHYAARGYFYSYLKPDGTFLTVRKPGQTSSNLNWFCSASPFQADRALVCGELTGFAIIDREGMVVADLGFAFDAAYPASEGLVRVVKGRDTGFLDTQGNEVIPCILDYARVRDFCCGLAAFQESCDSPWGFFNRQLDVVVPPRYTEVGDFSEGLATVKRGDLYGFVDTRGQEVVGSRYLFLSTFENGLALAGRAGMRFYIDSNGVEYQGEAQVRSPRPGLEAPRSDSSDEPSRIRPD
ncbi:MAG: WG repeat-containing protein [Vulcanimicrobiota bacterium]